MNILHLPIEMVHKIFTYLPPKSLIDAKLVCKPFNAIARTIPAKPNIPLIARNVLDNNVILLWEDTEAEFYVEHRAGLILITTLDFGKKISKMINREEQQEKINKAVEMTLKEIYRINHNALLGKNELFSVTVKPEKVSISDSLNLEEQKGFSSKVLAGKILNSKQFSRDSIKVQATVLQSQSLVQHLIRFFRAGRSRSLPT